MYLDRRALTRAGITDPVLRTSYEQCRRLAIAAEGTAAVVAIGLVVPERKRPYGWALYGFLRYADDVVESAGSTADVGELDAWCARLLTDLRTGRSRNPIMRALIHATRALNIDPGLVEAYLGAQRMDLTVTEYPTYASLQPYLAGVFVPIGRMLFALLDSPTEEALVTVDTLSKAWYLTDIITDVGEDLRRGHLYLPLDELAAFSLTRTDLEHGRVTPALRNLLRFQIDRVRRLCREGIAGIATLSPSRRPIVRAGTAFIHKTLDDVERRDYDVFATRPWVSTTQAPGVVVRVGLALLRSQLQPRPTNAPPAAAIVSHRDPGGQGT